MSKHCHHKKQHKHFSAHIGLTATRERRCQQGGLIRETVDRNIGDRLFTEHYRAKVECILDAYLDKGILDEPLHQAGMKYREIYITASECMGGSMFDREFLGFTQYSESDKKITNYILGLESLEDLEEIVTTPQQRVLQKVCGYNEAIESIADKIILLDGLTALAKHWGII